MEHCTEAYDLASAPGKLVEILEFDPADDESWTEIQDEMGCRASTWLKLSRQARGASRKRAISTSEIVEVALQIVLEDLAAVASRVGFRASCSSKRTGSTGKRCATSRMRSIRLSRRMTHAPQKS